MSPTALPASRRSLSRLSNSKRLLLAGLVSAGALLALPEDTDELLPRPVLAVRTFLHGVVRCSRTLVYMGMVAVDYKYTWWRYPLPKGQPEFYYVLGNRALNFEQEDVLIKTWIMNHSGKSQAEVKEDFQHDEELRVFLFETTAVHQRSAQRLLHLLLTTKGLYIKIGQAISAMETQIPKEYAAALKVLQDAAPASSFQSVRQTLQQELGAPLETFFAYFDPEPIAAASVAQVHRAVLHSGQEVAVKVQHQPLRRQFEADMFAQRMVMTLAERLFDGFDLAWMHPELRANLAKELDFENEGRNGDRCASLFADNPRVVVPRVFWELTAPRVLTMEYIHGVKVTDTEKLARMGISAKATAETAMSCLTEQIFLHGFVHCDPHPGNIFVRPLDQDKKPVTPEVAMKAGHRSGGFQLVLLDHGLYRELREDVRINYCKLWQALVLRDYDGCASISKSLGVENWEMFAMMVLMRPYVVDKSWYSPLDHNTSFREVQTMRKRHVGPGAQARKAFFEVMKDMPAEFLLVFRNQNYLRGLNKTLGCPVNRFTSFARTAVKGISRRNVASNSDQLQLGHKSQVVQPLFRLLWHRLEFELYLAGYDWGYWLAGVILSWLSEDFRKLRESEFDPTT
eukprot:gb/GEZN01002927.1/.p1 GENE.gb/GEZN01002927.1/~~gb/GEZN01002927.1/.p1  ORF type:complete len:658 (+),score=83.53 gb/GEZN01002927.1/:99-1976(+)